MGADDADGTKRQDTKWQQNTTLKTVTLRIKANGMDLHTDFRLGLYCFWFLDDLCVAKSFATAITAVKITTATEKMEKQTMEN